MRLFVAVTPPLTVMEQIEDTVSTLRPSAPPLRWTQPEDRHLTLVFLGEIPEHDVADIDRNLGAEVTRHPPLSLVIRGGGTFPKDPTQARVLWTAVDGDVHRLTALSNGLRTAARNSGIQVSGRPFVPHLTLARGSRTTDLSGLRARIDGFESHRFTAAEVRLMRSRGGARSHYETIATWELASPRAG